MSATVTSTSATVEHRHASYDCKTPAEHIALYDKWAATYNDDVMAEATEYVGPATTVAAVQAAHGRLDGEIFDAGCGTGLSGTALAQAGAKTIDGIDISPGMLKLARETGVYRDLAPVDMNKPLDQSSDKYDVVTCVGTFTTSHVGPSPALGELVRVLKKGGILAATILDNIWKSDGFETEVQRLKEGGKVEVVSTEITDYRRGDNARARMLVLRKK